MMTGHPRSAKYFALVTIAALLFCCSTIAGQTPAGSQTKRERPLNLVVLGDSVSWGQGLRDEHKAWYLVKTWLQQTSRRDVYERIEAHSGATIGVVNELHGDAPPSLDGELSRAAPTINDQIDSAVRAYASPAQVDLVLVDGCINDLDSRRLLNAANTSQQIRELAVAKCGDPVQALLSRIVSVFPNAHVIVTGYYPIVSEKTANDLFMRALAKRFYSPDPGAPRMNDKVLRARLISISSEWYQTSTQMLRTAAANVNAQLTGKGSLQRVLFADAAFRPEHAFAAKHSRLWGFDASALRKFLIALSLGHVSLRPNDERRNQRSDLCERQFKQSPNETHDQEQTRKDRLMRCQLAAVGHPNRKGAAMYADAIGDQLKTILNGPGWVSDFRPRAAQGGPLK
jgi:hypothetical protein